MLALLLLVTAAAPAPRVAIAPITLRDVAVEQGSLMGNAFAEQLGEGGGLHLETPETTDFDATGFDYVVRGHVARVGEELEAGFELVSAKTQEAVGIWSGRAVTERQLVELAETTALKVRTLLLGEQAPRRGSFFRWVPIIMGGVALAGSVALYAYAFSEHRRLVNGDPAIRSFAIADALAGRGKSLETTAWLLGGLGLVLVGGGVLFALLAPESDVRVGAAWSNGPVLAFSAVLP